MTRLLLFGHRGAAGEAPENTLAGFAHARSVGVDAFETDVRLTADGKLVLMHDESPARTTGVGGTVASYTAAQLGGLDARGPANVWAEPVGVPTLREALDTFSDLQAWQIEIKTDSIQRLERVAQELVREIQRADIAERTTVTSFDVRALKIMRRHAPDLRRGFISSYDRPSQLESALALGCANVCIPLATSDGETVRRARAHGLHVTGWLGNTEEDLARLAAWGCDSITTDYPGLAIQWLQRQTAGPA